MDGTMKTELILEGFHMEMDSQSIAPGQLRLHSDGGTQYASEECCKTMSLNGIKTSMSGRGDYGDNFAAKTFFASLK